MGACQSMQDSEEEEKKKRSRAIDAKLEEDSRRLRRECKILLLGKHELAPSKLPLPKHTPIRLVAEFGSDIGN